MPRLLIHVEGETEEAFVNEILRPHLYAFGYHSVSARLLGNARLRERRGGIKGWQSSRRDILRHLRGDPGAINATMVDYYALPSDLVDGWPGRLAAKTLPLGERAAAVENAVLAGVASALGRYLPENRFIPSVLMHEFEALLFSDCQAFSRGLELPRSRRADAGHSRRL